MSLSSDKIYKRKPSIILRQQLLKVLLGKYIKRVYCNALLSNKQSTIQFSKIATVEGSGRHLLRQEYYNDISECLLNYCQLNRITDARFVEIVNRYTIPTDRRQFTVSINKDESPKKCPRSTIDNINEVQCAKRVTNVLPR